MNLRRDDAPKEEAPVIGRPLEEAYGMKAETPLGAQPEWREGLRQWAKEALLGSGGQRSAITAEDALSYARVIPGISTTDLAALRAAYIEGLVWNGVAVVLGYGATDEEGKRQPPSEEEVEAVKALVMAALAKLAA